MVRGAVQHKAKRLLDLGDKTSCNEQLVDNPYRLVEGYYVSEKATLCKGSCRTKRKCSVTEGLSY